MRKPTYEKGKARRSLIPIQLSKALVFILITDMFKLPSIDMLPLPPAGQIQLGSRDAQSKIASETFSLIARPKDKSNNILSV